MVDRLRASVVCVSEGRLLVVRLREPESGVENIYPPGGGVEPGEEPWETARRETLEETGLRVKLDPDVHVLGSNPFRWDGVDYIATTHFFSGSLEDRFELTIPKVKDVDYNLGASWVPVEEALQAMAVYPVIAASVARVLRLSARKEWQRHPHISGPASMLLMIHDQFRGAAERLRFLVDREPSENLGWVARAFRPLAETLHHHHHAEEAMLFPLVEAKSGVAPRELVSDHQELTSAIADVENNLSDGADKETAKAAVTTFAKVLLDHLDREEMLVVPLLLQIPGDEAWALMHA